MKICFFSVSLFLATLGFAQIDSEVAIKLEKNLSSVSTNVHCINGGFSFATQEVNLMAAEPLKLSCRYYNNDKYAFTGKWTFIPHLEMCRINEEEIRCADPDGQLVQYFVIDKNKEKTYYRPHSSCNISFLQDHHDCEISGRSNRKNHQLILFFKDNDLRKAEITVGDGSRRIYRPMQKDRLLLCEEITPNQTVTLYEYDNNLRLSSLKVCNPLRNKVYRRVHFGYKDLSDKEQAVTLTSSDQSLAEFAYFPCKGGENYYHLSQTKGPYTAPISVVYEESNIKENPQKITKQEKSKVNKESPQKKLPPKKGPAKKKTAAKRKPPAKKPVAKRKPLAKRQPSRKVANARKPAPKAQKPKQNIVKEKPKDKDSQALQDAEYITAYSPFHFEYASQGNNYRKIKTIKEPIGENAEYIPTHFFSYSIDAKNQNAVEPIEICSVKDTFGNETEYYFSSKMRLNKMQVFVNDKGTRKLHHIEKFDWKTSYSDEYLQYKIFFDPQQKQNSIRHFFYDTKGNVLKEIFYGNLTGTQPKIIDLEQAFCIQQNEVTKQHCLHIQSKIAEMQKRMKEDKERLSLMDFTQKLDHCLRLSIELEKLRQERKILPSLENWESYAVRYEYSQDGLNLPLKKQEENGKTILYSYLPHTDLVVRKLICDKTRILQRYFYEYNDDHILVKTIEDDGSKFAVEDVSDVIQRKVKIITLREKNPGINLPETIEEKYFDTATKTEKLLKKIICHYDNNNNLVKEDIYDAKNTFCYSLYTKYDDHQNIVEKTDPLGRKHLYQYDDQGRLIQEKKANAKAIQYYFYDAANRKIKTEEKAKDITRCNFYKYDTKHHLIEEKNDQGLVISYERDAFGNILEKKYYTENTLNKNPVTWDFSYGYDAVGNVISIKDPYKEVTKKEYNAYHQVTKITHPDGHTETFLYNLDGTLQQKQDPQGVTTKFSYDALGRVAFEKQMSSMGNCLFQVVRSYSGFQLLEETDMAGNVTKYIYDGAGRKVQELLDTLEGIETKEFVYDALGRCHKIIHCNADNSRVEVFERDVADRIIEKREEDLLGKVYFQEKYAYDDADNIIEKYTYIQNQECKEQYDYDDLNRCIKKIDAQGNVTTYAYSTIFSEDKQQILLQKLTLLPEGKQIKSLYDIWNQLVKEEEISAQNTIMAVTERTYDYKRLLSEIVTQYLSDGKTQQGQYTWEYDTCDKIVKFSERKNAEDAKVITLTYDKTNRIKSLTQSWGTTFYFDYDLLGNLISFKSADKSIYYTYAYDILSHLISFKDVNANHTIFRTVDTKGKILQEIFDAQCCIKRQYDEAGRVVKMFYPDASFVSYHYDAKYLRKVTRHNTQGIGFYSHCFMNYDWAGNLLEEKLIYNLDTMHYQINALGKYNALQSNYFSQNVSFDNFGNIDKIHMTSPLGDHDISQQRDQQNCKKAFLPLPDFVQTFFDNRENKSLQKDLIYDVDALGRVIEITKPQQYRTVFSYDPLNRKRSQTHYTWKNNRWKEIDISYFLYDNDKEIGRVAANGTMQELRVLAFDIQQNPVTVAIEIKDKVFAPVRDLFGNIISLISSETFYPEELYFYNSQGKETIYINEANDLSQDKASFKKCKDSDNPWRYLAERR